METNINGIFKGENFRHLSKYLKLDDKEIGSKVKINLPEFDNLEELEKLRSSWDNHCNNSGLVNVKQVAYWHLIKEKQDEIN